MRMLARAAAHADLWHLDRRHRARTLVLRFGPSQSAGFGTATDGGVELGTSRTQACSTSWRCFDTVPRLALDAKWVMALGRTSI